MGQATKPEQSKRLSQAVRRSDLRLVQDAGHMVTYADGTAIAQAVETMSSTIPLDASQWLDPTSVASASGTNSPPDPLGQTRRR